jgi:hypothetical protein
MLKVLLLMIPLLQLKSGVELDARHLDPEIVRIVNVARATAPKLRDNTVWITSAAEKAEGRLEFSLHYKGDALDFRIRNVLGGISVVESWAERMQFALGHDYDVVLEDTHIHIEFDPDV